ncbi:MAG: YhfC family intramembrane metalloprotease [Treponema sp.]|jgi:uncharacterized membrane protein YhfC|nr:YhfC family intramembrane metalloprotease [Treponema sp.]
MHVPIFSMAFMAVSAVISIGLPVFLFIVVYKKYNGKFIPMIIGASAFIIFVLILESSIHSVFLGIFKIQNIPVAYIIYGALMAGLFEETARFLSFTILKKKYNGIGTGLSYGIGHGGIEAIMFVGIAMIGNLVFSIIINTGNVEILTMNIEGEALTQLNAQINALTMLEPYMFLVGGVERLFALGVQISLSIIVYYSVYCKNKLYLYPLAVIIHALIDVPAMLMQTGIIKQVAVVEISVGISSVILLVLTRKIHEKIEGVTKNKP